MATAMPTTPPMNGTEIRRRIIAACISDQLDVLEDVCRGDDEMVRSYEKQYGLDVETLKICMRGILHEFAGEPKAPGPSLKSMLTDCVRSVLTDLAATAVPLVVPRPEPPAQQLSAGTPAQSIQKRKPSSGKLKTSEEKLKAKSCAKHPGCTEFDKRGVCRQCQRDYQKAYNKKRAAMTHGAATPPRRDRPAHIEVKPPSEDEIDEPEPLEDFGPPAKVEASEFVYSKLISCSKCGASHIRLRRRRDADLAKDYWLHVRSGGQAPCQLRISHYNIKIDSAASESLREDVT